MALQSLERDAAIAERQNMVRLGGERALEGGKRVLVPVERQQHVAAIVQEIGLARESRQQTVKDGERLVVAAVARERGAEIERRRCEVRA